MNDLHQLRCFVAVAEELHFSNAAKRLFMTQAPLSRQIQLLERALGVVLLERSSRHVNLTAAGRSFLRDARQIIELSEQAITSAQRVSRGEAGRLTIGFTAVSAYSMLPDLLTRAAKTLPDVDFVLREMVSATQIEALVSNVIDVGFVRQLVTRHSLEYRLVQREPLVVALPVGAALGRKDAVAPRDLDQHPFVMYSPGEGRYFYDVIAGLFAATGCSPNYVQHIGQTHTILALVKTGLGAAIVPASAQELHFSGVEFRPLNAAKLCAELYLAWRGENDNPALPAFQEMVENCFGSGGRRHPRKQR